MVEFAKKAALDKKGLEPVILNLGKNSSVASYFLVVHGTSDRHVRTIADHILEELEAQGEKAWHVEGLQVGRWALLDYGDVVVHVFHHEARKFYNLERLWGTLPAARKKAKKKRHAREN